MNPRAHAAHFRIFSALGAVFAACALAGCLNQSNTLIAAGANPTPDLQPTAAPAESPATAGLDRTQWPVVSIHQPRGQVETSLLGGRWPEGCVQRTPPANPPEETRLFR